MFDTVAGPIPVREDGPRFYSYASAWGSSEKPNSAQSIALKDGAHQPVTSTHEELKVKC
jgi:hypothetical protein